MKRTLSSNVTRFVELVTGPCQNLKASMEGAIVG